MAHLQNPELRLAVSMAGGSSLALYMNGVAQQLFELSQAKTEDGGLYPLLLALAGYREAKLDVISGTSAGGMNAILLAAAIANKTDLNVTEELLIRLSDIHRLLQAPGSKPKSILRGDLVKDGLREALDKLVSATPKVDNGWDIDLLITGSHLAGSAREYIDVLGSKLPIIDHRAVFHFRHRVEKHSTGDQLASSDLCSQNNGLDHSHVVDRLATAGRVSSSLPAAFEPPEVSKEWNPPDREIIKIESSPSWMADGGYRNARPIDLVLDIVKKRKVTSGAVTRKVILVEPALDRPRKEQTKEPNFLEHLFLYHQIATAQDLEGTLQTLEHHNQHADLAIKSTNALRQQLADTDLQPETLASLVPQVALTLFHRAADNQAQQCLHKAKPERSSSSFHESWIQNAKKLLALERKALRATEELYAAIRALKLPTAPIGEEDPGLHLERLFGHYKQARDLREDFEEKVQQSDLSIKLETIENDGVSKEIDSTFFSGLQQLSPNLEEPFARLHKAWNAISEAEALTSVRAYFEVYDILIFPTEYASGLSSQQKAEFAIFHADVQGGLAIGKMEDKLAGEALGKLAGFLREAWRRHDVCWGHIDGSAQLIRLLLQADDSSALLDRLQNESFHQRVWNYLGFSPNGNHPVDSYGQYLQHRASEHLETLKKVTTGEASGNLAIATLVELLTTRHHLHILEKKMPRLLACEVLESQTLKTDSLGPDLLERLVPEYLWPKTVPELTDLLEQHLALKGEEKLFWLVEVHKTLNLGEQDKQSFFQPPLSKPLEKAFGLGVEIAYQGSKGSGRGLGSFIFHCAWLWIKGFVRTKFAGSAPKWVQNLFH